MKKIYFFLSCLLALVGASSVKAQSWVEPVEPTNPTQALLDSATDPEVGGAYYIMNVGWGQFVTASNSWSTQTSLSSDGVPYLQILVEALTESEEADHFGCVKLKLNGEFTVNGDGGSRTFNGTYLFRDNVNHGFIDRGSQACYFWKLTPSEMGDFYYWQSDAMGDFTEDQYAGAPDGAGKPVIFNAAKDSKNVQWLFIPVTAVGDDYKELADAYKAASAIYEARLTLYDMLNDAVTYGADYNAASEVYNNADATADELNAAIEAFKPIVTKALLAYAKKNSTAEEPVDITKYMIVNPNFETRTADGWTVDKIGANCGFQNNAVYANEEEGVLISNFIEAWRPATAQTWTGEPWTIPPYYLLDGKICQTIDALPAGHYILECDGIARNQAPSTDESYVDPDDYKGIYLFYSDGSITVHSTETLKDVESGEFDDDGNPIRVPSHFVFEFDINNVDSLTIGLMTDNTNMNWMAADNFKLSMAGSSQQLPSYVALQGEVSTVAGILEKVEQDLIIAEQAVADNLESVYKEVKPLVDAASDPTKDAAYVAAYTKLIGARNALTASEADYKKAYDFIDKLTADHDAYELKAGYAGVVTAISNLHDSMQQGYDERTLTSAAITSAIDGYSEMIKSAIQVVFNDAVKAGEPLEEGLDITPLFEHMGYAWGTSQVAFSNGYPAENPVWMNESKTGNFKTNYSTAEVWDARPFNIYREFKGLPKGKYTIKVHALYRVKANADNYANYWAGDYDDPDFAWLYANNNKVHLTNIAEMATSANIDGGVEVQDDPHTGGVGYLVNNQSGAYKLFTDPAYADAAEKGYIGVSANVLEDGGSFTAGIRGTENLEGNHWVLWYNFELYYDGMQESLDDELQALLDDLQELERNFVGSSVATTVKLMADAKAAGEAALGKKVDVQAAAILQLQAAIKAANESEALCVKIMELHGQYETMLDDMIGQGTFSDMRIEEILEDIQGAMDMDEFESDAQIQAWIAELPEAWVNYILSMEELNDATLDDPVALPIIVNPDYTQGSNHYEGWTIEGNVSGGNVGNYNEEYLEFWNNRAGSDWTIYQELAKLKEGYYTLQVDGLYRAAGSDADIQSLKDGDVKMDEYIFANNMSQPVIAWTDSVNGALIGTLAELHETVEYAGINGVEYKYEVTPGDTVRFVAPNTRANMKTFANVGRYQNRLNFSYVETDGPVRIGLKALTTYANNWSPFGFWKLYYLGTEPPVAVKDITSGEQAIKTGSLYTIDGRLIRGNATLNDLRNAGRGIYILNGKKVVVK